jgi:hypothetical protein
MDQASYRALDRPYRCLAASPLVPIILPMLAQEMPAARASAGVRSLHGRRRRRGWRRG